MPIHLKLRNHKSNKGRVDDTVENGNFFPRSDAGDICFRVVLPNERLQQYIDSIVHSLDSISLEFPFRSSNLYTIEGQCFLCSLN
jgi:hypothetical protein